MELLNHLVDLMSHLRFCQEFVTRLIYSLSENSLALTTITIIIILINLAVKCEQKAVWTLNTNKDEKYYGPRDRVLRLKNK
jgi:hypothetical protein